MKKVTFVNAGKAEAITNKQNIETVTAFYLTQ